METEPFQLGLMYLVHLLPMTKTNPILGGFLAVHENLLFFPMQFIWPVNTDKMRFNSYIYIF